METSSFPRIMDSLADCWKRCVEGPHDGEAWNTFMQKHGNLVGRISATVAHRFGISNRDDIEEAVQEVCLKLAITARAGDYPNAAESQVEAYLRALMANAAHDFFRARRAKRRDILRTEPLEDEMGQQRFSTADSAESDILLGQIEASVAPDPRDRNVFLLYFRQGWTAKEIAALPSLGLTPKGVESLIHRITGAIRRKLGQPPLPSTGVPQKGAP
jgi:RNA polymerase sigma-70 factor (ECF subfamily)